MCRASTSSRRSTPYQSSASGIPRSMRIIKSLLGLRFELDRIAELKPDNLFSHNHLSHRHTLAGLKPGQVDPGCYGLPSAIAPIPFHIVLPRRLDGVD